MKTIAYGVKGAHSSLKPMFIERQIPVSNEVQIDILFCGVCHSDVHQVKNEWNNTIYPCIPGHEIIGRVTKIGSDVQRFKIDDIVGVGCMIDSCHQCDSCNEGLEQYCAKGFLSTYNGNMRTPTDENVTFGGYSETIVVREDFILKIPNNLELAAAAPLLCAGITTYSPLKHWNVGKETQVGIIGFGGLGHIATKLAVAMGAEVTVITSSSEKITDAKALGAKNTINSTDEEDLKKNQHSFDFILNTIPQPHDVNPYISLLKRDGVLTVVGCIAPLTKPIDLSKMIPDRKSLGTSLIGGIAETQELLDFCGEHNIVANVKVIPIEQINEVFAKIDKGEVDFRYVINMVTIRGKEPEKSLLDKLIS